MITAIFYLTVAWLIIHVLDSSAWFGAHTVTIGMTNLAAIKVQLFVRSWYKLSQLKVYHKIHYIKKYRV